MLLEQTIASAMSQIGGQQNTIDEQRGMFSCGDNASPPTSTPEPAASYSAIPRRAKNACAPSWPKPTDPMKRRALPMTIYMGSGAAEARTSSRPRRRK